MISKEDQEIKDWISKIIKEELSCASLHDLLKDGVILCKIINNITTPSKLYPRISMSNFVQMENILFFIESVKKFNVPDSENFSTPDLFENKDMKQVIICLYSLSRNLFNSGRTDLPVIGPRLAARNTISFTEEQLNEAKKAVSLQYGYILSDTPKATQK